MYGTGYSLCTKCARVFQYIINRLYFIKFVQVIRLAKKREITPDDFPHLDEFFNMKRCVEHFETRLSQENHRHAPFKSYATLRIFLSMFRVSYAIVYSVSFVCILLHVAESIILNRVIQSIKNESFSSTQATSSILLLIALEMTISLLDPQIRFWTRCLTIRVHKVLGISFFQRLMTVGLAQQKALQQSSATPPRGQKGSLAQTDTNVFVLLAADCDNVADSLTFIMETITAVILIVFILGSTRYWNNLPTLIALALLFFLLFLSITSELLSAYYQNRLLGLRDYRLEYIQRVINDIQNVKILNWEDLIYKDIRNARRQELRALKYETFFIYMSSVINQNLSPLLFLVFFAAFYLQDVMGIQLTAAGIISTQLALYHVLRHISHLGRNIQGILFGLSSCSRLDQFYASSFKSSIPRKKKTLSLHRDSFLHHLKQQCFNPQNCVCVLQDAVFTWGVSQQPKLHLNYLNSTSQASSCLSPPGHPGCQSLAFQSLSIKSLHLEYGQCTVILGAPKSGKTLLFSALLNEICLIEGYFQWFPFLQKNDTLENTKTSSKTRGFPLAYCAQNPWLPFGSLRDAILFHRPYDEHEYQRVIQLCQLQQDIEAWEEKNDYNIVEGGRNLSQGQRCRVALARALYRLEESRICLLDGLFDSLDVTTSLSIFQSLFGPQGYLKDSATLVSMRHEEFHFLSHSLSLHNINFVVYTLEDGHLERHVSYRNLSLQDSLTTRASLSQDTVSFDASSASHPVSCSFSTKPCRDETFQPQCSTALFNDIQYHPTSPWKAFFYYMQQFGLKTGILIFLLLFLYRIFLSLAFLWTVFCRPIANTSLTKSQRQSLRQLTDITMRLANSLHPHQFSATLDTVNRKVRFLLQSPLGSPLHTSSGQGVSTAASSLSGYVLYEPFVYVILASCAVTTLIICMGLQGYGLLRASRLIHENLLKHFLTANLGFHYFLPAGALLNRFSIDTNVLDLSLTLSMFLFVSFLFSLVVLGIVLFLFNPGLCLVVWFVVLCVCAITWYWYIPTNKELQRVRLASLTPVSSLLADAETAMVTIRAFQKEERLLECNFDAVMKVLHTEFVIAGVSSWLYLLQRHVSLPLIFYISISSWIANEWSINSFTLFFFEWLDIKIPQKLGAEIFGFTAFQVFTLPFLLGLILCQFAEFQGRLCSVQRILDIMHFFNTAQSSIKSSKNASLLLNTRLSLPQSGLSITHLESGYIKLVTSTHRQPNSFRCIVTTPVLRDVTLQSSLAQTVALVGRTGSGKSTLLLTLLNQAYIFSGSISLNGLRLSSLSPHDVRTVVAYLPNTTSIVQGWSIRRVLDPLNSLTDDELFESLRQVHLLPMINALPSKLETRIQFTINSLKNSTSVPLRMKKDCPTTLVSCCMKSRGSVEHPYHYFTQSQLFCLLVARLWVTRIPYQLILIDELDWCGYSEKKDSGSWCSEESSFPTDELPKFLRNLFPNALLLIATHHIATIRCCDQLWLVSRGRVIPFQGSLAHLSLSSLNHLFKTH